MQLSHLIAFLAAIPEVALESLPCGSSTEARRTPLRTSGMAVRSAERHPVLSRSARFRYDSPQTPFRHRNGNFNMDVTSAGSVGGAGPIRPVHVNPAQSTPAPETGGLQAPQDEVEISSAARLLDQIQNDPQIRAEKLAAIQAAIADGSYESPEKLEIAVDRLLEEIQRSGG